MVFKLGIRSLHRAVIEFGKLIKLRMQFEFQSIKKV
jgi:hypothetical protein